MEGLRYVGDMIPVLLGRAGQEPVEISQAAKLWHDFEPTSMNERFLSFAMEEKDADAKSAVSASA